MPPKDSIANTLIVSLTLCIVCSLLVSGAAVALKPLQDRNRQLDRQKNIIAAAGLADTARMTGREIMELYEARVSRELVDLESGQVVEAVDEAYDPRKAVRDSDLNTVIESPFDIGLSKREKQTWVYLVKSEDGQTQQIVLPIYGMGLWSTLYGYVALDRDLRTIQGLTFYEHAETPGLGGEVENPVWKSKWVGKQVWATGEPRQDKHLMVGVAKGAPPQNRQDYMVDGLSGATITSRGVDSMLKYWFSDDGFGPYIRKLASQKEGAANGSPNS